MNKYQKNYAKLNKKNIDKTPKIMAILLILINLLILILCN